MTSEWQSLTCDLSEGGTVMFDAPYTEAGDYDDTDLLFDLFNDAVGA